LILRHESCFDTYIFALIFVLFSHLLEAIVLYRESVTAEGRC